MKKLTLLVVLCLSVMIGMAQNYSKIAIVGTHYDYDPGLLTYGDDDEKAAAEWLISQGGIYIGAEQIMKPVNEGGINLNDYDALWIHLDRITNADIANFREFQLGYLADENVLNAIKAYYKNGGNLLLTTHASIYLKDLGRIDFDPDIWGAGEGADNNDIWFVSPTHGTYNTSVNPHDMGTDPLYTGLSFEWHRRSNNIEYKTFPMQSGDYKEDHNCFWTMDIPDNIIGNGEETKLTTFQSTFNVDVLATWSHVEDYFGAAIARWKPTDEYKGTAITIGAAAYEWNTNQGTNIYQHNVIRLTRNALKELAPMKTTQHLVLTGEWSDDEFASLDHKLLTSLDLTGVTSGLNSKPSTINPNCLVFVADGSTIFGDNIIVGNQAQNIVLVDGDVFANPTEFKTYAISYERDFNNMSSTGWASLYIPFDITNLNEEVVEEFVSCDGSVALFKKVSAITANTPYIMQVTNLDKKTFAASDLDGNLAVVATISQDVPNGDYVFKGTYNKIQAGAAEGLLMLKSDGSGYAPGGIQASIPSFRSYIEYVGSGQGQGVRQLSIIHEDGGATDTDNISSEYALKIWKEDGKLKIYSSSKQMINVSSINGQIIETIQLNKGTITLDTLQHGVYIINGQKIII